MLKKLKIRLKFIKSKEHHAWSITKDQIIFTPRTFSVKLSCRSVMKSALERPNCSWVLPCFYLTSLHNWIQEEVAKKTQSHLSKLCFRFISAAWTAFGANRSHYRFFSRAFRRLFPTTICITDFFLFFFVGQDKRLLCCLALCFVCVCF